MPADLLLPPPRTTFDPTLPDSIATPYPDLEAHPVSVPLRVRRAA
ncbi:hypothetical protein [Mycobacterium talmoniae]|uniref:Uncharacterized protein n=1 Tax=Mycobacterium talmoniae TaxID=1858794 RepID=A0A2S8BCA5_9MYCO|nr:MULTISPECIES: hypothetical protein [Mycobacterium]PQM44297.1 hypothetical protein C1Y40_05543 [Mycobacterium talmoniae]